MGRVATIATALAAAATAFFSASAAGEEPGSYAPYDGHNPFNCEIQDVGTGTDFPHPDADPFCVEFDKTQQNVTDLGLADFLSKEPARTAAASDKCFYYQHDHWTGSVVQGGEPEAWHWDGSYFFDKARALGGVYVENFRIGGRPADFGPYAPAEMQPYLAKGGGGGVFLTSGVPGEPSCAEKVDSPLEQRFVYYHRIAPGKIFRKRITPVRLRTLRAAVIRRLGPAHRRAVHTDRWDVAGGGELAVGWRGTALDRRVAALLTTSPGHRRGPVHPGIRGGRARRLLHGKFAFGVSGYRTFEAPRRTRSRMLFGIRGGKLAWVAVVDPRRVGEGRLRSTLANLLARAA